MLGMLLVDNPESTGAVRVQFTGVFEDTAHDML